MNKKILSIIFTLFLAGLLSISCSNKDTTGPGDNNGGGSTTPTIPTGDGDGINSSYTQYKFFAGTDEPLILTLNDGTTKNITTKEEFQMSVSKNDPNLQDANAGGILIKMPALKKDIGFSSDVIRIPAKNILSESFSKYTIHTLYFLNADKTIWVELKSNGSISINRELQMDVTLTKITAEKDKDPVTETYNLKTKSRIANSDNMEMGSKVQPIDIGNAEIIDPNY